MKVVNWIAYDEIGDRKEPIGGLGGWFNGPGSGGGMRWKDYIDSVPEDARHYFEGLRDEVLRLDLRKGGDWHQSDERGVPVFEDDSVGTFSYRAWGDLLAAIWSEADGVDHTYMDYYMSGYSNETKEKAVADSARVDEWTGKRATS